MKIARIEDLHCDAGCRDFSFLKITTDDGLVGWSEYNESYGNAGLTAVIRRTVECMTALPAEVALLLRVRGNTATERWALERRRELDRIVTALVREAVEDGDLRADLDPALVTRLVFGMTNSVVEWYRPGGPLGSAEIVQAVRAIVFDGLEARDRAVLPQP